MNPIEFANQASQRSDRWLFLAALGFIGLIALLVSRYWLKQHEALIADHKEARAKHESSLTAIVDKQGAINTQLAVVLDRNTKAMEDNTVELRRCREQAEKKP